ncbi:MAG: serine/threonine protein kinase [Myxococcaceae bacterium]|nr:serine/threonine protein kinase [Myxococcaceae bacterium]
MEHLTAERCADLAAGRLPADDAAAARAHVDSCALCATKLQHAESAARDVPTGELTTGTPAPVRHDEAPLERGTQVGRYVVLDVIGQGGMGMVYAAFDPELDRRVALKLLKAREVSDEGKSRLMREAQAMARLQHPGVVSVYDAGVHQGRIYVAMELVAGATLKEWLLTRRPWREVVRVFVEAGGGLAAAHAAHLVHRDFKPANVLIGEDGRVRVTDFGLARADGEVLPELQGGGSSSHSLSDPLTQVGSVVGTVGYMAPEQILSKPLDARTDQFAFCVCLWEALYGRRPFTGDTAAAVTQAVLDGRLPEAPWGGGVPKRLHALLMRGLSREPSARFPSMEALLGELTRDPLVAVKRAAPWLAAAGLLVVGVAGFSWQRARASRECQVYAGRLAGVWGDETRQKVRGAFEATKVTFALAAYETAARGLDAYARAWADQSAASCEATRVQGRQSDEAFALREACFARRLEELSAVSAVLGEADGPTVERSVTVVYGLTPLSSCEDVARLKARAGRDVEGDAEGKALRELVVRGKALIDAGRYAKALEVLEPAAAQAKGKRPALHAEAELLIGTLLQQTGRFADALTRMQAAFRLGLAAGLDEVAARAAIAGAKVAGILERPGEARMWLDTSAALVERLGNDSRLQVDQLSAEGIALATAGKPAEAAKVQEQALNAAAALYGADHPLMWKVHFDLGTSQVGAHEWLKALPARERALEQKQTEQVPAPPQVALVLANLGKAYFFAGQPKRSRESLERALDIRERLLGPESPRLVPLLNNLGDTLAKTGDVEGARPPLQRAIALAEKTLGPKHGFTAAARISLAEAELSVGKVSEANVLVEQVLAASPPPAFVAEAFAVKAFVLLEQGKAKEAKSFAESGVTAAEGIGKSSAELILPLTALGEALLQLKGENEAVAVLERALKVASETRAWPVHEADVQFPLARALLATGGDSHRALGLAAEAEAAWGTTGARAARLKTLEAWKQAAR